MTTRTIGRDLPDGSYVEVTGTDHDGSGDYFAVTFAQWDARGKRGPRGRVVKASGAEADVFGSNDDTILAVAPELAPLVTVHCATTAGTPMHALENGWYFYSGASARYELKAYGAEYVARMGTDHDRAARALHVAPADLPTGLDREGFAAFAQSLTEHWAAQADAARACLEAMTDGEGVQD